MKSEGFGMTPGFLESLMEMGGKSRIEMGKEQDSRLRSKWGISESVTRK